MTVNSRVIKTFLQWSPDAVDVPLMNGLRIQILPTIEDLPRARKHQFAAFIASEALLVVWDDEALHLVQRAKSIESELMELVWKTGEPDEMEPNEGKKNGNVTEVEIDEESGEIIPEKRPTNLLNTILVTFTLILIVTVLGAGFREIAIEIAVDHQMIRLAFLALTPVQIFFTLVSNTRVSAKLQRSLTLKSTVLRSSYRRMYRPMHWSRPPDAHELKVLLRPVLSKVAKPHPAAYHHPMSRVQGRLGGCHRAHCEVDQAGHIHLRTPGRVGQHVCQ